MSGIQPLDNTQVNLPQSEVQPDAGRRADGAARPQGDIVDVKARSLAWQRMDTQGEEPISREQAFETLNAIINAPVEELAQAHTGLDPQRVYQLLGLTG